MTIPQALHCPYTIPATTITAFIFFAFILYVGKDAPSKRRWAKQNPIQSVVIFLAFCLATIAAQKPPRPPDKPPVTIRLFTRPDGSQYFIHTTSMQWFRCTPPREPEDHNELD
jgi:hypothetical protein